MAFELLTTNQLGDAVIDQPGGVLAGEANFIDPYDYATQYAPSLVRDLHLANGKGRFNYFLKLVGQESSYASDQIKHAEQGRLHNFLKDVSVSTNTFTVSGGHNLRAGEIILISDGSNQKQAKVTSITSATVFVAEPSDGVAFAFTGNVSIWADFSNSFAKGTENFSEGKNWNPTFFTNYTHILKDIYNVAASDMIHDIWVNTPDGPRWFNFEMAKTNDLFENKIEYTQLFHERAASGDAPGVQGIIPNIENYGNVANELITDIEELSDIALRMKQQGGGCKEFTVWARHSQMAALRRMLSGVNAHYADGAYYGVFQNSKGMAISLDFKSVYIEGITFHFSPWDLLDEPTTAGGTNFINTSIAYFIVPTGSTSVTEDGKTVSRPYISYRYRRDGNYSRKREVKIFGPKGTTQSRDAHTVEFLSEFTNQMAGTNNFLVGREVSTY